MLSLPAKKNKNLYHNLRLIRKICSYERWCSFLPFLFGVDLKPTLTPTCESAQNWMAHGQKKEQPTLMWAALRIWHHSSFCYLPLQLATTAWTIFIRDPSQEVPAIWASVKDQPQNECQNRNGEADIPKDSSLRYWRDDDADRHQQKTYDQNILTCF